VKRKRRGSERWVAVTSDILDCDSHLLSDAAFRLFVSSVAYAARYNLDEVPRTVVRMFLGLNSRKAVRELVENGFWVRSEKGPGEGYLIQLEGRFWRRGLPRGQRKPIPREVRAEVFERDGYACTLCGSDVALTLDHVFPWSLGGEDDVDNLRLLCQSCNSRKGARA
jgi:hypothetical protein